MTCKNVIDYARNSDKTEKEYFVTGINCDSIQLMKKCRIRKDIIIKR